MLFSYFDLGWGLFRSQWQTFQVTIPSLLLDITLLEFLLHLHFPCCDAQFLLIFFLYFMAGLIHNSGHAKLPFGIRKYNGAKIDNYDSISMASRRVILSFVLEFIFCVQLSIRCSLIQD